MVTRIRKLLEQKQLTPTQFADLIGVGRPVMSHILSERNKPSLEVVQRIISAFPELSLPWLLSGTGEMLATDTAVPAIAPATSSLEASPLVAASPSVEQPRVTDFTAQPTVAIKTDIPLQHPNLATKPAQAATPELPKASEVPVAPSAQAPITVVEPPVVPQSSPVSALTTAPPVPKPFRPARMMPPVTAPTVKPVVATPSPIPASVAEPATVTAVAPAPVASSVVATPSASDAAALAFLAEPGKSIRRIVIFYRDGSFTDYQPEQ
jgi:transcriptional regulator with XRE-family HTH domain